MTHCAEELTGRCLHGLVHHTKADGSPYPAEDCPMLASLRDGAIHRCDQDVYWRKDGSCFPVEFTSTPIVDGEHLRGAAVVFRDVTDRREIERAKDQFTSVVSHELRTPLTSIRGSLGLLESGVLGPFPAKGQRMIQIAVEDTDRLVRLINDILDLERMDSGAMHLRHAPCDAAELIAQATDAVLPLAVDAGVTITVDSQPAPFAADADRLIQTLTNVISNAVKFSPAGSNVQVMSKHRNGDMLFEVSDRGRGIPADKIEPIFECFQQVAASDSRAKGGTGLGLAICRTIVEHHGGRTWAHSVPGEGSTFSFGVPAAPVGARAYIPQADGRHGLAVLVCDDDAGILEVVGTALEERGYRVIPARSGVVAVERAIAERPDAIVLDRPMAGMRGAQTVAALRKHPETVHIPIVILSVLPPCQGEMPSGAVVDWIQKPPVEAALFRPLKRAIGSREDPVPIVVYTAHDLEEADRDRPLLGSITQSLTERQITPEEFERRIIALLGPRTGPRMPETRHEPEAHSAGR